MGGAMKDDQAKKPFSWGEWTIGFIIALFVGFILNIACGFLAMDMQSTTGAVMIELVPAVLLALAAYRGRRNAFQQGVLAGAALVAIVGGLCGTTLRGPW